jgi:hypothetical protein
MTKAGWLRFASTTPDGQHGNFWLTPAAEMLWKVLQEKAARGMMGA